MDKRGNRIRFNVNQKDVAYLLEPKEQFARAYAQYIAVRSRDNIMLGQLEGKRGDALMQGLYCQQWMDDDFAPIASEIEAASCVGRDGCMSITKLVPGDGSR